MARSRKFLTVGALGVASFALIGAGATATFNDEINGSQTVRAGVLNMTVRGADASTNGKTVRWATAVTPVGSTFTSGRHVITITNEGTIPARRITLTQNVLGTGPDAASNDALYRGIYVRIDTGGAVPELDYRGPLADLPLTEVVNMTIPTDFSFNAEITYYAGMAGAASLANDAQGAAVSANWKLAFEG
jgi:hypothetical protein